MTTHPTSYAANVPAATAAGPGARIVAYLVDAVVVISAGVACFFLADSWLIVALVCVEGAIAVSLARAATGRTPGSLAVGMVAFATGTDHAPGLSRQSLRSAVQAGLHLTILGPVISAATTKHGQDWADRVAGTAAVKVKSLTVTNVEPDLRPVGDIAASWPSPAHQMAPAARVSTTPVPDQTVNPQQSPAPRRLAGAQTSAPAPIAVPRPAPAQTGPVAKAWAIFDSGQQLEFTGVLVLGREPVAKDPAERAVPIADPSRSLSRTHLRVGVDAVGLWIEDAFSTNGTGYLADGQAVMLTQGTRIRVSSGTVVLFGDYRLTLAQLPQ